MGPELSESFEYAFSRDLLVLYAVIAVGVAFTRFDTVAIPIPVGFVRGLLSFSFQVLGVVLVVGGVVSVLHQIASDATG